MTLTARYWPRGPLLAGIPTEARFFRVTPDTQLLGFCHWQPDKTGHKTVVLVHGLEGSSDSHYMRGIATKAYTFGMNVIRLNQRNCGGTEHLTPTLYNSGLGQDFRKVVDELASSDGLERIWLVGYSMGGNLVLRTAGEAGTEQPALAGVVAVCPNIDPTRCVDALELPSNRIYHHHFLISMKGRMRRKSALYPGQWDLAALNDIRTLRLFDDLYTAKDGGYLNGADYYDRAGARHVMGSIAVPTTIITAQDDPFIPYGMFESSVISHNPAITLIAPRHGGHCGFLQSHANGEDRYWAENRIVELIAGIRS
ncbi:putative Hydrolase, alpha/beta fold family [Nitrospira sp. KM1]|nr:putative Hydrolase, alpha/beta fold family [Nitrospira sp. KM1]